MALEEFLTGAFQQGTRELIGLAERNRQKKGREERLKAGTEFFAAMQQYQIKGTPISPMQASRWAQFGYNVPAEALRGFDPSTPEGADGGAQDPFPPGTTRLPVTPDTPQPTPGTLPVTPDTPQPRPVPLQGGGPPVGVQPGRPPEANPAIQAQQEAQSFVAAYRQVPVKHHNPGTALKYHQSLLELGDRKGAVKYHEERGTTQFVDAEQREEEGDIRAIRAFEAASLGWTNDLIRDEKVRGFIDGNFSGITASEYLHLNNAYDGQTGFLKMDYVVDKGNVVERVIENFDKSDLGNQFLPKDINKRENIMAHLNGLLEAQLTEISKARSELRSPKEIDWSAVSRRIEAAGLDIDVADFQLISQELLSELIQIYNPQEPKK